MATSRPPIITLGRPPQAPARPPIITLGRPPQAPARPYNNAFQPVGGAGRYSVPPRGQQFGGAGRYPSPSYGGNYPPPPPPPRPPNPVSFMHPLPQSYRDQGQVQPPPPRIQPPPPPPGTSEHQQQTTQELSNVMRPPPPPPPPVGVSGTLGPYAPLAPPPLPPIFPYLSQELAQSLHDGATQCGTTFKTTTAELPFVPVIVDDNDLKKMTESVKTQFEETQIKQLLLYEDIIDQSWPKELRDMFQPLYCKLCKITLSSPVVARDHYKGKRHLKAAELWLRDNPSKVARRGPRPMNGVVGVEGPIPGTVKQVGPSRGIPPQAPFRGDGLKRGHGGFNVEQQSQRSEFIPAYRAALAQPGPVRKRPRREGGAGQSGPNYGYCSLCDVHHTSPITAEQHYSGKNHKAKLASLQEGNADTNSGQQGSFNPSDQPQPPHPHALRENPTQGGDLDFRNNFGNSFGPRSNNYAPHYNS